MGEASAPAKSWHPAVRFTLGALVSVSVATCTKSTLDLHGGDGSYGYRRSITVAGALVSGSASLASFPVRVEIDDPALRSVAAGGHVASAQGLDLSFAQNGSPLDFEVERYDASSGTLHAWVRIPSLAAGGDTTFQLYYGANSPTSSANPTGVWDASFRAVWHLEENPDGPAPQVADSTANALDGTSAGVMTAGAQASGVSGGSLDFDGIDDEIDVPNVPAIVIPAALTVSAWVSIDVPQASLQGFARIVDRWNGNPGGGYGLFFSSSGGGMQLTTTDGVNQDLVSAAVTFSPGVWHHVAGVWSPAPGATTLFIDGVAASSVASMGSSIKDPQAALSLGGTPGNFLHGKLDEVRLSATARSAAWIQTEYRSVADPAFCVAGPEESGPFAAP